MNDLEHARPYRFFVRELAPHIDEFLCVAFVRIARRNVRALEARSLHHLRSCDAIHQELQTFLSELAFFTNLFIAGIELILFYANRTGKPAPSIALFALVGAMFVFVVLWIIHLFKAFKLPKPKGK